MRRKLLCTDPVEVQYYSETLVSFPNIYFYCGAPEETLVDDSGTKKLRSQYAVLFVSCAVLVGKGLLQGNLITWLHKQSVLNFQSEQALFIGLLFTSFCSLLYSAFRVCYAH